MPELSAYFKVAYAMRVQPSQDRNIKMKPKLCAQSTDVRLRFSLYLLQMLTRRRRSSAQLSARCLWQCVWLCWCVWMFCFFLSVCPSLFCPSFLLTPSVVSKKSCARERARRSQQQPMWRLTRVKIFECKTAPDAMCCLLASASLVLSLSPLSFCLSHCVSLHSSSSSPPLSSSLCLTAFTSLTREQTVINSLEFSFSLRLFSFYSPALQSPHNPSLLLWTEASAGQLFQRRREACMALEAPQTVIQTVHFHVECEIAPSTANLGNFLTKLYEI